MDFYSVFKHLAFKFDAEFIHDLTLNFANTVPQSSKLFAQVKQSNDLSLQIGDLKWSFPVGVAAGFDKNAKCIPFFESLGFGAIEVGTITKEPQVGNPKPRVFRHPEIKSVQNAMGFPNQGSVEILNNLKSTPKSKMTKPICLGANIGKNKDTTEADTPLEYAYLYKMFASYVDYLVVNISSPNTPGLRSFQKKELLAPILEAIAVEMKALPSPTFIKIAPDMADEDLKIICELSKEHGFSGIIATNTTVQHDFGKGGLSGSFIKPIAKEMRRKACEILKEDPTQQVIGVGGIDSFTEIKEFWKQGGGFVQVYTGFIYEGPKLLTNIYSDISAEMKQTGCQNLQELYHKIRAGA